MAKKQSSGIGMFERAGRAMGTANLQQQGAYQQYIDYSKGIAQGIKMSEMLKNNTKKKVKENPNGVDISKVPGVWQQAYIDWARVKKEELAQQNAIMEEVGADDPRYSEAQIKADEINKAFLNFNNKMDQRTKKFADLDARARNANGRAKSMTTSESNMFDLLHNDSFSNPQIDANGNPSIMDINDPTGSTQIPLLEAYDMTGSNYNPDILENDVEVGFLKEVANYAKNESGRINWDNYGRKDLMYKLEEKIKENPNAAKNLMFQHPATKELMLQEYLGKSYDETIEHLVALGGSVDPNIMSDRERKDLGEKILLEEMKKIEPGAFADMFLQAQGAEIDRMYKNMVGTFMKTNEDENTDIDSKKGKFNTL